MDQIKEAFKKVKLDIDSLRTEILTLNNVLTEILLKIKNLEDISTNKQTIIPTDRQTDTSTHSSTDNKTYFQTQQNQKPTLRQIISTDNNTSTHSSTDNLPFKALKKENINISIGNQGVSTDRQTDRQTDTSTHSSTGNKGVNRLISSHNPINSTHSSTDNISNPAVILNQLDSIKKDIRLKIKRLTNQEMIVFSTIYQLDNEGYIVDYSLLSKHLSLSESSIRDYIKRILNKGFLLEKEKVNNKKVIIHIPADFKRLISLNTLISLRDI